MKKLKREQLKAIIAGGGIGVDTGIEPTEPTGPACGGSQCPNNDYICCYHPTGNYCVTTHCDYKPL